MDQDNQGKLQKELSEITNDVINLMNKLSRDLSQISNNQIMRVAYIHAVAHKISDQMWDGLVEQVDPPLMQIIKAMVNELPLENNGIFIQGNTKEMKEFLGGDYDGKTED